MRHLDGAAKAVAGIAAAGFAVAWLAAAPGAQTFRSGVDLASFGVTAVDRKGGLVTDLTRDDFEVREDGQPQTVTLFARGDATESVPPLRLGLLFDTSGSMEESIGFSRSAAIKFLNTVHEAQDITLVDFDTEVRVVRYGQHDFPRLVERIRKRKPDGNTALYDAMGVYLDGASSEEGRRTLVLYTDGGDTSSTMSYDEAQDLLKASDITLYAIGFLSHLSQSPQMEQRRKLRALAELTGGLAFFPRGNPMKFPVQQPDGNWKEIDRTDELIRRFEENGIDALITVGGDGFRWTFDRRTGAVSSGPQPAACPSSREGRRSCSSPRPRVPASRTSARDVEPANSVCSGWTAASVTASKDDGAVTVTVKGAYDEADGWYAVRIDAAGRAVLSYEFKVRAKTDPRQYGLVVYLPRRFDTLSWSRRAQWTTYPANHIGR